MSLPLQNAPVLVVGAGIMGAGIAQVAAQTGHLVFLFDVQEGAAEQAKVKLANTLAGLVAKGKLQAALAQAALARIQPVASLQAAASARLVVEAIVENLGAKRSLFQQLETVLPAEAVLASNTSSISVTAIANGLKHPGRLVGMHFFNPVPLMKLVEVVSGLQTHTEVAEAIFELSKWWGKVPVHAKSTPGFIVNRIARPYYAETLALLLEQAATPQEIDACLRAAGFRMGPCELMDLIGHDTNFAVTNSVYEANFFDKRYVPSLVQREMVEGGWLGRKSGQGFFRYLDGKPASATLPIAVHDTPATAREVTVHGAGPIADALEQATTVALAAQGWGPARAKADATDAPRHTAWTGIEIDGSVFMLTDGRTAAEVARAMRRQQVVVFDRPILQAGAQGAAGRSGAAGAAGTSDTAGAAGAPGAPWAPGTALAFAVNDEALRPHAAAWLAALGFAPLPVADTPGLLVARTVAMLINEAADAVNQGVCTAAGADAAMKLGVNYPAGPFEFLANWPAPEVVALLDSLDHHCRGERYRVSPWLRRLAIAWPSPNND
jgi:3-hydroxybutyryl-CoA dehydrogenase